MKVSARRLAAALGAVAGAPALQAAGAATLRVESDEDLLEAACGDRSVVRLATGQRQSARRAPAVASVITAADIEARAGVINIVMQPAAVLQGDRLGLAAGSFGTRDAWWQHGQRLEPVDAALSLHRAGTTCGARKESATGPLHHTAVAQWHRHAGQRAGGGDGEVLELLRAVQVEVFCARAEAPAVVAEAAVGQRGGTACLAFPGVGRAEHALRTRRRRRPAGRAGAAGGGTACRSAH